jgi:hypothetical protein
MTTTTIEVLDPEATADALKGSAARNERLNDLSDALTPVLDTGGSIFATGLDEPTLNMLRTKLLRRNVRLSARKVHRGAVVGHVLMVTTKEAE